MRVHRLLYGPTLVLLLGAAASAQEPVAPTPPAEPEWRIGFVTLGTDALLTSAFVWRGLVAHDGTCVQPDLWAQAGPLTFTSWLNVRGSGSPNLNEHDFTVDYSRSAGRLTLSAGWTNYAFFEESTSYSNEFYVGASYEGWLSPAVRIYQDVQQGTGTYVSVSGGREWQIPRTRISASTRVGLGYNHHQYVDTSGFSDLNFGLALTIPFPSARMSLTPSINYSFGLQHDVFPSKFCGGVALNFK